MSEEKEQAISKLISKWRGTSAEQLLSSVWEHHTRSMLTSIRGYATVARDHNMMSRDNIAEFMNIIISNCDYLETVLRAYSELGLEYIRAGKQDNSTE